MAAISNFKDLLICLSTLKTFQHCINLFKCNKNQQKFRFSDKLCNSGSNWRSGCQAEFFQCYQLRMSWTISSFWHNDFCTFMWEWQLCEEMFLMPHCTHLSDSSGQLQVPLCCELSLSQSAQLLHPSLSAVRPIAPSLGLCGGQTRWPGLDVLSHEEPRHCRALGCHWGRGNPLEHLNDRLIGGNPMQDGITIFD